jgi:site-specific DNA recombinase
MSRAAREGRYTGGIVAYGYRVEGTKQAARHVADDALVFGDLSAAAVVRRVYEWLGEDGWTCRRIADELNALGVPTHYARDGRRVQRGLRLGRTRGVWRPGRIRNMVVNPIYRGELRYGRRTQKRDREVIAASVEPLVSAELWQAAQETLARNRTIATNTRRAYLLRGVIHCGIDGLTYCGSQGRDTVGWYRCSGQIAERGPLPGRCWGKAIRTDAIEPIVWADIEAFLRNPGEILAELQFEHDGRGAVAEADSVTLTRALANLAAQEARAIDLAIRGVLGEGQLRPQLDRIEAERAEIERRLTALERPSDERPPPEVVDLLADVRRALDAGLSIGQRQELVRLLVQIVIHTETADDGRKTARAVVHYRFPAVVETRTGTGSSRRRAGNGRETS